MQHDLTDTIAWNNKPAMAIITSINGDQFILPPFFTYVVKGDLEYLMVDYDDNSSKYYSSKNHTDPSGNFSFFWAYKHAILDASKNSNYIQRADEGSYRARNEQGSKKSYSVYEHYGLPCVRGITLFIEERKSKKLQITATVKRKRYTAYTSDLSRASVLSNIRNLIAKMPDEWKSKRVIPQEYL